MKKMQKEKDKQISYIIFLERSIASEMNSVKVKQVAKIEYFEEYFMAHVAKTKKVTSNKTGRTYNMIK